MGVRRRAGWPGTVLRGGGSAQVGGDALYYEASGPELGPTVLFLHESGGSVATWEPQMDCLGSEARCLALDLPGHGRSQGFPIPSVQAYREWVLSFLDALAIRQRILIVGLCLGAAIALDVAAVRPDRVAGAVLSGAIPGGRASARTRALTVQGDAPAAFVDELLGPVHSPGVAARWLRRWRSASPAARAADLMALAVYDWQPALDRLTCPLLCLEGALDPSPSIGRRGVGHLVQIPGAGGLAPLEQPVRYASALREFMDSLDSTDDYRALTRFG